MCSGGSDNCTTSTVEDRAENNKKKKKDSVQYKILCPLLLQVGWTNLLEYMTSKKFTNYLHSLKGTDNYTCDNH